MSFIVYPAIDLIDGKCVRLYQGDYSKETIYENDPVAQALEFEAQGAEWVHLVDLDAARTGSLKNTSVIQQICGELKIPIQVGGGIRTSETAKMLFEMGVERTVIGTAAVEDPELVSTIANAGHRVAVGVDGKDGYVATRGWKVTTELKVAELLKRLESSGAEVGIVTEIQRDGTLQGSDLKGLTSVLSQVNMPVIASGGLGSVQDLHHLLELEVKGSQLAGVITGKALYERHLILGDLISEVKKFYSKGAKDD
ncbi:MAG: 1-(5-phosphoribosyl)-5-[(5-phosphoribosylamino)methylideneamino]imidazole-4-carboxamide isomerase [Acidimicrobiaceae bacterium]|jgi:phosphoribosylformimino-5-aminoimidazole carboxamide ribotide isomerase|nr:1-(5-phosphoribosyl)-5-[(5-phosphoribosylamino)methylideneamino]imidazole-4-carboxamide isomerase [Acidimicrobiaceae bacterium]|tara:strand:- start:93523 stop:94284 length:762 start_codon:yes stop_codon:yes gene_type:complete